MPRYIKTKAFEHKQLLKEIESELANLKIIEESLLDQRRKLILHHNETTLKNREENKDKRTDRKGQEINIGDIVFYNTKGGNHSINGKVIRFTKHFIVTKDSRGNEVRRKGENVTVTAKKQP